MSNTENVENIIEDKTRVVDFRIKKSLDEKILNEVKNSNGRFKDRTHFILTLMGNYFDTKSIKTDLLSDIQLNLDKIVSNLTITQVERLEKALKSLRECILKLNTLN